MSDIRGRRSWLALAVLGFGLLPGGAAWADGGKLLIDAIDVEGGAATLYITPEHRSLLIDTGWPADVGAKDPDSAQRIIAAARRHCQESIEKGSWRIRIDRKSVV